MHSMGQWPPFFWRSWKRSKRKWRNWVNTRTRKAIWSQLISDFLTLSYKGAWAMTTSNPTKRLPRILAILRFSHRFRIPSFIKYRKKEKNSGVCSRCRLNRKYDSFLLPFLQRRGGDRNVLKCVQYKQHAFLSSFHQSNSSLVALSGPLQSSSLTRNARTSACFRLCFRH